MDQITDHSSLALARLVEKLKSKANVQAWLDAFSTEVQAVEDTLWQLYASRGLETAYGIQLDKLGRVIGEERNGREDESYRTHLRARIKLSRSSGTGPEILEIFALLTDNALTLAEQFPAAIVLKVEEAITSTLADDLVAVLRQAKAAGVRAILEWTESDTDDTFTMDAGPGLDDGVFAGADE